MFCFKGWCGGRDSNSRTSKGIGPEPIAIGHTMRPPQLRRDLGVLFKVCYLGTVRRGWLPWRS